MYLQLLENCKSSRLPQLYQLQAVASSSSSCSTPCYDRLITSDTRNLITKSNNNRLFSSASSSSDTNSNNSSSSGKCVNSKLPDTTITSGSGSIFATDPFISLTQRFPFFNKFLKTLPHTDLVRATNRARELLQDCTRDGWVDWGFGRREH